MSVRESAVIVKNEFDLHENRHEWFRKRTRFDTEAKGNSHNMHDDITTNPRFKIAYCRFCHEQIPKTAELKRKPLYKQREGAGGLKKFCVNEAWWRNLNICRKLLVIIAFFSLTCVAQRRDRVQKVIIEKKKREFKQTATATATRRLHKTKDIGRKKNIIWARVF